MGTPRGNTVYGKVLIDMHSHHIILCGSINALSTNVVAGSSDRKEGGRDYSRAGGLQRRRCPSVFAAILCAASYASQPASQPTTTTWPSFRTATLWTTLFIFTCGKEIICWWSSSEFSICLKIVRASFPKKAFAYPSSLCTSNQKNQSKKGRERVSRQTKGKGEQIAYRAGALE